MSEPVEDMRGFEYPENEEDEGFLTDGRSFPNDWEPENEEDIGPIT